MATQKQIQRENRILNEALDEFSIVGFHSANLDKIAERAHVGKATVYRHYGSKEGLYYKVFERIIQKLEEVIREKADFSDFREGVETAMKAFFKQVKENPRVFEFLKIFSGDKPISNADLVQKMIDRYFFSGGWAVDEIVKAQAGGQVNAEIDPELLAYGAFGMVNSLAIYWIKSGKPANLSANVKLICETIFNGITPRRKDRKK